MRAVQPGARIVVVRNPRSGSALDTATLQQAVKEAGVGADLVDIPNGPAFDEWIDRLAARYAVIAAAGGDGTVSSVAAAVARAGKTLAVIPTGTMNHFARDAGIPTELDAAAALLRTGRAGVVDLGIVNHRCFLNNVSLGSYPRMVHERTELERRGHSRRLAAIVAIARTWWRLRSVTTTLTVDGRDLIRRSPFIVVGNGRYDLSGFDLTRRDLSDHHLSLYVAPRAGRLGALSLPLRALVGTLDRYEQFEIHRANAITIALTGSQRAGRRHVLTGIDGEVRELESPLRFAVKRGALQVLLPQPAAPTTRNLRREVEP
jgi:diacylglycerol kinase family enzyme